MFTELGRTGRLYARVTIDALPDNVLLEIFYLYLDLDRNDINTWLLAIGLCEEDAWHTLVHVCSTWRRLVFASPRRLNLRLLRKNTRPVRKTLNVWPELPITIYAFIINPRRLGTSNIMHTLNQRDRVYKIDILNSPNSLLKQIAAVKKPFPALTDLTPSSQGENPLVLPDSFSGGSAPRLQKLNLYHILFPALGKLVLPALTRLHFKGNSEYLEDIMSRVDTPRLRHVEIWFFNQLGFYTPYLHHFIART